MPKRLDSTFALDVLQVLTGRELEIVEEVAHHPCLSCEDLTVLFNAKSNKATSRSLQFLHAMRVLARVNPKWTRSSRVQYFYMLDRVGLLLLSLCWRQNARALQKRLGTVKRQLGALAHTVEINRFFLKLLAESRLYESHELEVWQSETQSLTRFDGKRGKSMLRPDGYGVYRIDGSRFRFFLEWDRGNSVMEKYRAKFTRYAAFYDAVRRNPEQFSIGIPSLWVVTVSNQREDFILDTINRLSWEYAIDIPVFTTVKSLTAGGVLEPIWRTMQEPGRRCRFHPG